MDTLKIVGMLKRCSIQTVNEFTIVWFVTYTLHIMLVCRFSLVLSKVAGFPRRNASGRGDLCCAAESEVTWCRNAKSWRALRLPELCLNGLDDMLDVNGGLSGGQFQKLMVVGALRRSLKGAEAHCLLVKPRFILLDEWAGCMGSIAKYCSN